jgi:hypothetical protein
MAPAINKKRTKKSPKKPAPVFLGKRRLISPPGHVSKTKTTAEKAAFLRRYTDLPFRNTVNFDDKKTAYINKLYDGDASGSPAYRRLSGARKIKIDKNQIEKFESSGYIVTTRTYRYGGKRKKGTYAIVRPLGTGSMIESRPYGLVEKIGSRIEYKFLLNEFTRPLFIDRPEWYIENQIIKKHKKIFAAHRGKPKFKILFSHGSGGSVEYESIDQLSVYLSKFSEENLAKITGIAVVFHVRNRKKKRKKKGVKKRDKAKRRT